MVRNTNLRVSERYWCPGRPRCSCHASVTFSTHEGARLLRIGVATGVEGEAWVIEAILEAVRAWNIDHDTDRDTEFLAVACAAPATRCGAAAASNNGVGGISNVEAKYDESAGGFEGMHAGGLLMRGRLVSPLAGWRQQCRRLTLILD